MTVNERFPVRGPAPAVVRTGGADCGRTDGRSATSARAEAPRQL